MILQLFVFINLFLEYLIRNPAKVNISKDNWNYLSYCKALTKLEQGSFNEVSKLINDPAHFENMAKATNPYDDGKACIHIIKALK
jgi:hypothetical protein